MSKFIHFIENKGKGLKSPCGSYSSYSKAKGSNIPIKVNCKRCMDWLVGKGADMWSNRPFITEKKDKVK